MVPHGRVHVCVHGLGLRLRFGMLLSTYAGLYAQRTLIRRHSETEVVAVSGVLFS